ncbi:MAG: DUF5678 domain-containing protein [bacterium]|nr:DUF5678 domain-containing protein [bacterium]
MAIDWTKNYSKYRGLWVALTDSQTMVITSGKTANEVLKKAQKKGVPHAILFRVPTKVMPYIGISL